MYYNKQDTSSSSAIQELRSELYIKPSNAGIILHYRSAHPKHTKLNTLRSQFRRAARLSSDEEAKSRSFGKIRDLFTKNGYPAHVLKKIQRQMERSPGGRRGGGSRKRRGAPERGASAQDGDQSAARPDRDGGVLLLPYVNETVLCKVKRVARKSGLDVNVASYTPDTIKRNLVHSSLTHPPCPSGNRTCNTCKVITKGKCTDKNVVYELTCTLCGAMYIGESKRPLRLRFNEHLRCAVHETELTPIGDHFKSCHKEVPKAVKLADPPLQVSVLMKTRDHPDRKIAESLCIRNKKPNLNENLSSWRVLPV